LGAALTGTSLHIEHIESDDPGLVVPYWHVQDLLIGELDLSASRGFSGGTGIGLMLPLRMVRDRIHFLDLAREPYVPPNPDTHHRNETLAHVADPQLWAVMTRQPGPWSLSIHAGTSIPIGRTEPNPFALGRLGLPHQHIQFGTGTWDPILGAAAARAIGSFGLSAVGSATLSFYENSHGYQAGNRYALVMGGSHSIGPTWVANAALSLNREEAETWSGKIEEEGNLGRTDLFAQVGIGRGVPKLGLLVWTVQLPIRTWSRGEQVRIPFVLSMSWTR